MSGLFLIAARNLGRNWLRTILTVLGAAVALIAFVMLRTVLSSWEVGAEYAAKDRLGTRHKVSFVMQLPRRYIDDIRNVPGVKQATWANWFGGKDPGKPNEFFATIAVDAPSFLPVMDELVLDEESKTRWLADKKGAIVGDVLAKKLGLKVGDKYILQGSIYPGDWEFQIDGIYTASRKSLDRSQFLFHWSYLNDAIPEARRDTIGWVMTRVEDPSKSADISAKVDKLFDERDTQTVTMSERNMQLSFMAMFGAILTVLDIVPTHAMWHNFTVRLAMPNIGYMQKGGALQANVNKSRLHARQHPGDLSQVDVAYETTLQGTLHVQLLDSPVFHDRHSGFLGRPIDQNILLHRVNSGLITQSVKPISRKICAVSNRGSPMMPE